MSNKKGYFLWFIFFIGFSRLICSCASGDSDHYEASQTPAKDAPIKETPIASPNALNTPTTTTGLQKSTPKITYNIFIENSGSMDGYVKGITEFEQSIYNLLSDIKISHCAEAINLYYVNSKIITIKNNATEAQIRDFIDKLNPSTFKEKGGDRTETDLYNVVDSSSKYLTRNSVCIIISDFIFSPGAIKDASSYLINQQIAFKGLFAKKIDDLNISTTMMRFHSTFDGTYYDRFDDPIIIHGTYQRPFYALVMGPDYAVQNTMDFVLGDANKTQKYVDRGYEEMCYFFNQNGQQKDRAYAKLTYKNGIGEYEIEPPPTSLVIRNAAVDEDAINKNIKFRFSVAVNFNHLARPKGYLLDADNYEVSPKNYNIKVEAIKDGDDATLKGYTHLLSIYTNELRNPNDSISIKLRNKFPDWINTAHSDEDSSIKTDTTERHRTYGLKYLMTGIDDAYKKNPENNYLFAVNVSLEKAPSGSSAMIWIILLLVAVGAGFFIFKTIKSK